MDIKAINKALGNLDLHLLDQILKGLYMGGGKILDIGCGEGRNLTFFLSNGFEVYGIDKDAGAVRMVRFYGQSQQPGIDKQQFMEASFTDVPFQSSSFDHVISIATLHFAASEAQFDKALSEIYRLLCQGGTAFVKTGTTDGFMHRLIDQGQGIYLLPDNSPRFLISAERFKAKVGRLGFTTVEPLKIEIIEGYMARLMAVLRKN